MELGNISHQTISEVWNGELFESERKRLLGYKNTPENYLCKRCKLVHLENRITGEKRMNFLGDRYLDENDRFVK